MLDTLRSVFSLLLSYALLLFANAMFNTLLGIRTQLEGFATETIGVIVAGYFLGLLVGGFFAARVVAAVGHIRAFAAFASVVSVAALVHVLWIEPYVWFCLRLASGFCMAGMIMVTESWLNERATNRNRGQVFSFYMITNYFAAGCGQFVLPLADPGGFELFSIASIVFSLALVPVLLTRATAPQPARPERFDFVGLWRTSPLGVAGCTSAGAVNATYFGLAPVFARAEHLTIPQISIFMACGIFGGLLLQYPVGRLSDRIDRRWVLTGVAFCTSFACIGIVLTVGHDPLWLYVMTVIYGGLSFTVYSLSAAHANDFADSGKLVQTAGGLLVAYGCGAFAGPLLAAAFMGRVGPSGMFAFSATMSAGLGLFALHRMRRRAGKRREERTRAVGLPGDELTSGQLYAEMRNQMDRDIARLSGGQRSR